MAFRRPQRHKPDAITEELVDTLRKKGCEVFYINQPVDLLVGYKGVWYLLEPKGRVRTDQRLQTLMISRLKLASLPVYRVFSTAEALDCLGIS